MFLRQVIQHKQLRVLSYLQSCKLVLYEVNYYNTVPSNPAFFLILEPKLRMQPSFDTWTSVFLLAAAMGLFLFIIKKIFDNRCFINWYENRVNCNESCSLIIFTINLQKLSQYIRYLLDDKFIKSKFLTRSILNSDNY